MQLSCKQTVLKVFYCYSLICVCFLDASSVRVIKRVRLVSLRDLPYLRQS
jgi:hypothetical protein